MSSKVKDAIRLFVGGELGYSQEGNIQWYYTISMIISCLVIWNCYSDATLIFMILSIIHFSIIYIYGSIVEKDKRKKKNKLSSIIFLIANLAIIIFALVENPGITFLSTIFVIFMVCLASIMTVYTVMKQDSFLPVIINLVIFVVFVVCVLKLPIKWYGKVFFILMEFVLHVVVDELQKYIPNVLEVADIAWTNVFK